MNASLPPAVRATALRKSFGSGDARAEVLRGLDLTLAPGAFEAVMGASGSGKSTLLHLLAGLLAPDSGRVEVGGTDVTAMSDAAATRFRRRHVGVVFQSFNLVETLDVAENVALPVRLDRGRPDAARLAALLARLGLAGKERRRPSELSGGERQRVAVARALFAQPDVVLADEIHRADQLHPLEIRAVELRHHRLELPRVQKEISEAKRLGKEVRYMKEIC